MPKALVSRKAWLDCGTCRHFPARPQHLKQCGAKDKARRIHFDLLDGQFLRKECAAYEKEDG